MDKATLIDRRNKRPQQILSELAQILFYQPLYIIMPCQMLVIAVVTRYFWDIVPHRELLIWTVYMNSLSVIFIFTTYLYRRTEAAKRNQQLWIYLFPLAGASLGMGWGSTIFWSNVFQAQSSLLFVGLLAGGFSAAGIATLGPYLRSFVVYVCLIILPFAIMFFLQGTILHYYLGIIMLVFLGVMLLSGYNMRNAVHKAIELRLDNQDLVNDLVEKNTQAEQACEEAELANLSKSKFLAAASHDLRQPLHALGLFVDALESRVRLPESREIVENIRVSTDALSDLFNALLDISKLDAGVLEPVISRFPLQPIFNRIETDFNGQASAKSLQLGILENRYAVETDPAMLERILLNLVSNAIRYTRQGSILLGCRLRGDSLSIEVHDTGIGIDSKELGNIFNEFYQLENPERDRSKGLGLGLSIVKRQAELLGCSVSVSSEVNKGSVFCIRVPRVTGTLPPLQQAKLVSDLEGTRVLVIDDERIIRSGMREVLESWQCLVLEAESAEQALDLLRENCEIDIILSDFRLRGGKTGIRAINLIHGRCGEKVPAIILTGDTDSQRLREAKNSGFKLLHKPVSPAKLRSLMSYLLDNRDGG